MGQTSGVQPKTEEPGVAGAAHDELSHALRDFVRRPHKTLFAAWSWKTATMSAFFRALIFLITNRRAGQRSALLAALVEAVFAVFASGLLGAVTQRLRATRPLWATALVIWVGMPLLMGGAQFAVHTRFATPHMKTGIVASFFFAAIASGFTWYAMRRGALLMGVGDDSLEHDVKTLPRIILDFVLWPVRRLKA